MHEWHRTLRLARRAWQVGRASRGAAPPRKVRLRATLAETTLLALASVLSYRIATTIIRQVHSVANADDLLGGMWAGIATVFTLRHCYGSSIAAAVSRMSATLVSFALCLTYLVFLPFHAWGLGVLVGLSVAVVRLAGRPEDSMTAAITTIVVMVVAQISPHEAWQQPILRLADTVIGVSVGIAAAWLSLRRRWWPR